MIVKIRKYPVVLKKTDTCLTYALKRIGLEPINYTYEDLEKDFHMKPFFFGPDCNSGVLLLWDANKKRTEIPWMILEDGRIVSKPVTTGIHVAVYEGQGLVSDCSRKDSPSSMPQLKMRHINELKRQPDWILIYKNLHYGGEQKADKNSVQDSKE